MFKAVIETPTSRERVKDIVFHIPSAVTCPPEMITGDGRERKGRRPPPVMVFNLFEPFVGDASSPRDCLMSMKHA
jgi:hypothetical protein